MNDSHHTKFVTVSNQAVFQGKVYPVLADAGPEARDYYDNWAIRRISPPVKSSWQELEHPTPLNYERVRVFDHIYNPDGTCTNWYCGKQGVVLAYDSFSPEFAHWFCADCWDDDMLFLDIVEDRRQKSEA